MTKKKDNATITLPKIKVEMAVAIGDVRFYLNHPYLDLQGDLPMLVATNGHLLLAAEVQIDGDVSEGPLPLEGIIRVRKQADKYCAPVMQVNGNMVGTGDVMFKRPDLGISKYPDWRKVVPEYDHNAKPDIAFKPRYLKLMADALMVNKNNGTGLILQRDKKIRSKHKPIDPAGQIVIRVRGEDTNCHYHAILMPMRFD